jgi:hypothetical protein
MGGGGKGGSTSTKTEIPKWVEEPSKRNLARSEALQSLGYMPYYGPDVAAFSPMQSAAFGATGQAAEAFGMAPSGFASQAYGGGMPAPREFAGGTMGYSSAPLFDQAVQELAARRPGQFDYYNRFQVNPMTGEAPASFYDPTMFGEGQDQMTGAQRRMMAQRNNGEYA